MQTLPAQILRRTKKGFKTQIKWRRHLHRYPELSFEEYRTTAYLTNLVQEMGLEILPISSKTGLIAELRGKSPGPTVAVRTDIDALPVHEQTGLPFRSRSDGVMHACGHDVHMATVLGVASVLSQLKEHVPGIVRFIFQPGEEMPPGGALPMIRDGALEKVSMIFGLHVDPNLSTGRIGLRDGVSMATVIDFDLVIHGRSGHAARPHETVDAVVAACEVVDSVQKIVSRENDPIVPMAITFGRIEGGSARNTIADRVKLVGTARSLAPVAATELPKRIKRIAGAVCRARGARLEMSVVAGYPVLRNDANANRILARSFKTLFGRTKIAETEPVLGGEDFARYLERVPGAMFWLGVRNKKIGADKPWHSPEFIADEQALICGTSLIAAAVLDCLSEIDK